MLIMLYIECENKNKKAVRILIVHRAMAQNTARNLFQLNANEVPLTLH